MKERRGWVKAKKYITEKKRLAPSLVYVLCREGSKDSKEGRGLELMKLERDKVLDQETDNYTITVNE